MQDSSLSIHRASQQDLQRLWGLVELLGYEKDVGYFEHCLERQEKGELCLFLAGTEDKDIGYCILNWKPKYGYFRAQGMAEIQDLNILHDYRRRGFGRAMVSYCESIARDKGHNEIGIGVGVTASYGAAQRLYVKMGYVPDGNGINYDRKQVSFGEFRPIDDHLCFMMTKRLVQES